MRAIVLFVGLLIAGVKINNATIVYLCDSAGGKKFHYKANCRGLGNCSHRIIKVTLEEAKKRGKTVCGWEK